MATVKMMRCVTAHWQGMDFVRAGEMFPEGDPRVIPEFFEATNFEVPPPKTEPPKKPE